MKRLNRFIIAVLVLLVVSMSLFDVAYAADATGQPDSPVFPPPDFISSGAAGGQAAFMERFLGAWGFTYSQPDGKWTAADVYELKLFQRWACINISGCMDVDTCKAMQRTYRRYGMEPVPREKLPLEGRYIGINPGHQADPDYHMELLSPDRGSPKKIRVSCGTQGVATRVPEYVVTLAVGLKLRKALEDMGARVIMTRTAHAVNISNGERSRMMNAEGVDVYLSLHCDGNRNRKISGLHTLIPAARGYQKGAVLAESQRFARIMQAEAIKATKAVDRGFSVRSDLTGFNWSNMPTCLVEMGFMTNAAEDKRLVSAAYQDKIVYGMAQSFVRFFAEKNKN